MPDKLFDNLPDEDSGQGPGTVKIGEEEWNVTDLTAAIEKAKLVDEAETKFNTPIDKVFPNYTRDRQILTDQDKLKGYYEEHFGSSLTPQTQTVQPSTDIDGDQLNEAVKLLTEKGGLMTATGVQNAVRDYFDATRIADDINSLEEEFNTRNEALSKQGLPKLPPFKANLVLATMETLDADKLKEALEDPMVAYYETFPEALDIEKDIEAKINQAKVDSIETPSIPDTEDRGSGGVHTPTTPNVTRDNLGDMLSAALEESVQRKG
jgi:hypothetical protein